MLSTKTRNTIIALAASAGFAVAASATAASAANDIKIGNRSQVVQASAATAQVTGRPQTLAFKIERFHISNS